MCFGPRLSLSQQPRSRDSSSPPSHTGVQGLDPLPQASTPEPSSLRPVPSSPEPCVQTSVSSPDPEQFSVPCPWDTRVEVTHSSPIEEKRSLWSHPGATWWLVPPSTSRTFHSTALAMKTWETWTPSTVFFTLWCGLTLDFTHSPTSPRASVSLTVNRVMVKVYRKGCHTCEIKKKQPTLRRQISEFDPAWSTD